MKSKLSLCPLKQPLNTKGRHKMMTVIKKETKTEDALTALLSCIDILCFSMPQCSPDSLR